MTVVAPVIGARPPLMQGGASRSVQSLQARITAAILLTAITVLFFGCTLFMLEQRRTEQLADHLGSKHLVDMLAINEAAPMANGQNARILHDLQTLDYFHRVVSGEIRSVDGRVLVYRRSGQPASPTVRHVQAPLRLSGRIIGQVSLEVAPETHSAALSHYLATGGALFFAATALALFQGRWLAARITTPVARLAAAMDSVGSSGTFQVRVEADAADEIGRLTQCFNVLMSRLHVKDMALRRTLDELVEARDAAEAANFAKSQFLANMSHEIRTPLNGVLAMAQVLARSGLHASQRDQVDVIHQSGETLLNLLNDILDVSKIEAGKLELEVADFDVEAVVQAAAAAFAAVAERKGLRLDVSVAPDARGVRKGDAARLRQILNNFLSNALKFTESGSVSLSVRGEGPAGADGVTMSVRDTGMGIAEDKQPLLFQKFTQLDASMTRRFGGTGLGLAICRELSEMMGGRVWVESRAGEGSTFTVLLPLPRVSDASFAEPVHADPSPAQMMASDEPRPDEARPDEPRSGDPTAGDPGTVEQEASEAGSREAASGEPTGEPLPVEDPPATPAVMRVLAAEDNETNRLVLSTVMQIFGVDLVLAGDGIEAVEAWRNGAFDVVLMDIQMPRMDGVAATRRIRAEEAASGRARTPILALSANALTHQVEAYLAAGMDGHVAKPIELPKLQAALEEVLRAEPAQAAA